MEKLIILGANTFQKDLVVKAKDMGYETHVFGIGWGPPSQYRKMTEAREVSDYYYDISITEKKAILELARALQPAGILTIGCDTAVPTISYVSSALGLTGNSEYSALISTNKCEMKKSFLRHGVPTAPFILYGADCNMAKFEWTRHLIVKSIDKSGKCGITKVEDWDLNSLKLREAVNYGVDSSDLGKVLIEEFIEGCEYSAECVSYNGEHHVLVFSEKYNIAPHFVEEIHLQPAPFSDELVDKLVPIMKKALDALEIKFACSHIEFKIDRKGDVYIIEVGARMAAESMWDVVNLSTGNDYIEMAIDIAVGKAPKIKTSINQCALVKFLLTEEDFDNLDIIKREHPEKLCRISKIDQFDGRHITKNQERYGYYVMKCNSRLEAIELTKPQDYEMYSAVLL
jgi:biotin carboxylase